MVPLIIFIPYIEGFNFEYSIFKYTEFVYDPVPLATMVLENRLIFASSLFDFATKLIPQLSIILSLTTASELLGRSDVKVIPGGHGMLSVAVKPKTGSTDVAKPVDVDKAADQSQNSVYDCHARNTTSPDDSSFDKLDHVALATLSITHCPELKMPPDLQRLENLVILHVYNSTISNWSAESSVSATAHSRLLSVFVGKTNVTEFPEGLLQPLPDSLLSVQFSGSNLTKLPDDLYMRWHAMAMIAFEDGVLTDIPYQMFFLPVYTLSLMGNHIETLPTLAMMPPGMIIPELNLKNNPLRELPATLMAPDPMIMSMNVQNTSITTMPPWVKTNTKVVWALDTPFCAAPMADPTLAYQVMCFERPMGQEALFYMYMFDALYEYDKSS
ncbi:hypothetical protein PInf_013282 [Phytophthora infestans]|nr:hypothetical protein PInf_013282 [Phytophthora infestans]